MVRGLDLLEQASRFQFSWISIILAALLLVPITRINPALGSRKIQSNVTRPAKRSIIVADAVRMTRVGDLDLFWGSPLPDQLAHFSPDGKKVVVIVRKGNLESNTREYSLLLWRTDDVLRSPSPKVVLKMSSSSNRQAIEDIMWLADNERIAFLGEQPEESHQVYIYNLRTRVLKRITNHRTNVLSYTMTPEGDKVAYVAEEPIRSIWDKRSLRSGILVSTQLLSSLVVGQEGGAVNGSNQPFFQSSNRTSHRIRTSNKISPSAEGLSISPDGRYLLLPTLVAERPEIWSEYSDPEMQRMTALRLFPGQYSELKQLQMIDLLTGESRLLLRSPLSPTLPATVAWRPDGHSVVVTGTYLPLDNTDTQERQARRLSTFAVEVDVASGRFTKITNEALSFPHWATQANILSFEDPMLARAHDYRARVFFRRNGDKWERTREIATGQIHPQLLEEEDMNTPPKIFAVDPVKHVKGLLLDPNPQFNELDFAKVEEIHWRGLDGQDSIGGLYLPVSYDPGKRYPLVIQTHGWLSKAFWIDGPFTTAFAAQPLAGKGIMVLQVNEIYEDTGTSREVNRAVASYEGAVKYLDEKGLIDPNRVGIIGFSRTCMFVKYALSHSNYHFVAASVTDGVDAGYFQYLMYANSYPVYAQDFEGLNQGLPFGNGLEFWKQRSPGFSIDKVRTPLRINALNAESILFEWEWFAGLTRLAKPVEMMVMRDGAHILGKPWERMISQQGNVDWFCFWLKGEEDPDPTKAEQYARWRELRKLQEQNQSKAPTN
jgi:dipeptidyl aminopeptidase/acylaminoacyl peptidase